MLYWHLIFHFFCDITSSLRNLKVNKRSHWYVLFYCITVGNFQSEHTIKGISFFSRCTFFFAIAISWNKIRQFSPPVFQHLMDALKGTQFEFSDEKLIFISITEWTEYVVHSMVCYHCTAAWVYHHKQLLPVLH